MHDFNINIINNISYTYVYNNLSYVFFVNNTISYSMQSMCPAGHYSKQKLNKTADSTSSFISMQNYYHRFTFCGSLSAPSNYQPHDVLTKKSSYSRGYRAYTYTAWTCLYPRLYLIHSDWEEAYT